MEITVPLNVNLHANQQLIQSCPARNVVVKAGKRFGKTKLAVYKMTRAAGVRINGTFWYIAPTYKQAKSIAWREFKEIIPRHLIKRMVENDLIIELHTGSTIELKGADYEDSLRGPKLHGVIFDEAAYIDQYVWNNIIRGQLLGSNGEAPGFSFFISSPNYKGVNWFSEFHAEAQRKMMSGDPEWAAFKFNIYDNPTLTKEQIDQIKNDSTYDQWAVEYMAEESAHAGQIYSEFNFGRDVTEYSPSSNSLLVRGVDWGIDHPTVCLFIHVDMDAQRIYVEDEYVQSGFTIEESSDVIKKKTGNRPVAWSVCDPSMNKRNSQTKRTDKQEFDRLGIYLIPGDNNNRGYNITKMFFKKGMIRIHPRCRTLINQIKNLQWTDKVGDDCTDALRYICVRIHDSIFGWNSLGEEEAKKKPEYTPEYLNQRRECNINNKFMFPDEQVQSMNFLYEEAEVY